jgi:hypothetical protein
MEGLSVSRNLERLGNRRATATIAHCFRNDRVAHCLRECPPHALDLSLIPSYNNRRKLLCLA